MESESTAQSGRTRMIAIVAGLITVSAIVLAFASGYLGEQWQWLKPAGELLLLAELVSLIVLERHQLFEPVHETVGDTHSLVQQMHAMMTDAVRNSGQVAVCASTGEVFATAIHILHEALAREQVVPQVLRSARLSGRARAEEEPDLLVEYRKMVAAVSAFYVTASTPADAPARRWSQRVLFKAVRPADFQDLVERFLRRQYVMGTSNVEVKILADPSTEAALSPLFITDRDVLLNFDDAAGAFRWGVRFQGLHYRALVERWFDDLWASIPDNYLVYSCGSFNETAIGRIRQELAAMEAWTAAKSRHERDG